MNGGDLVLVVKFYPVKNALKSVIIEKGEYSTVKQFAETAGLSMNTISKIFNKPEKPVSYQTARKIAIATGKAVDELFTIG